MSNFDVKKVTNDCVQWIKDFFEKNGKDCMAVVGISGGKDSSVVAALSVEALGKDRVIGVLMPNGEQSDIDMARKLVEFLDIRNFEVNIKDAVCGVLNNLPFNGFLILLILIIMFIRIVNSIAIFVINGREVTFFHIIFKNSTKINVPFVCK